MFSALYRVRASAWVLLAAMALLSVSAAVARTTDVISSKTFVFTVQPVIAVAIYILAYGMAHEQPDRVRHRSDKAFLVGSVLAIWFVAYFLSGFITTYTHNSLVAGFKSVAGNIWTFGAVAFALEYARNKLLLIAGRRNAVWFGVLVSVVLAAQQMNIGLIPHADGTAGIVKLVVSDFVPALAASFLLTYLAVTSGLPAVLTYRLGLVAIAILPPIIPKYDWYLQCISLLVLASILYFAVDRSQQDRGERADTRHRHKARIASDVMGVALTVFLAIFMSGFLTYKPSVILSNSMKPVFSRGSMVIVQKKNNPLDVQVGDIVQYWRRDIKITHRVVAIDATGDGTGKKVYITKGDNNPSKDPPVNQSQVIGIVRAKIPFIGYPTVWLTEISKPKAGHS
jgi:signal peptidase